MNDLSNINETRANESRRHPALRSLLSATLLMGWIGAALATEAWNAASLMQSLSEVREAHATYTELTHLALLDVPLKSAGELYFRAPDRLEKRITAPRKESMLLDGDTLTLERGQKKISFSLRDKPELAAFIDSVRATMAGDLPALQRTYVVELTGNADSWRLLLSPRAYSLLGIIRSIEISGRHKVVQKVVIDQADGDYSVMQITSTPDAVIRGGKTAVKSQENAPR